MTEEIDVLVIGAGVVGLAIARGLARAGLETIIADGESSFGRWTSSRNSGVIHAGIYYPAKSMKAKLCVRGRDLLYAFCEKTGVPHRAVGKLLFATATTQSSALDAIQATAMDAGVLDLKRLDRRAAKTLEPALKCQDALLSPSTGIVDVHSYMTALLCEAEDAGAIFASKTRISRITSAPARSWFVYVDGDPQPALVTRMVINAAGLAAHQVAKAIEGLSPEHIPKLRFARGVYFSYVGQVPFRHLIYPIPLSGGLGTHLTLDMSGAAHFGPDIEWIETIDYTVNPNRKVDFLEAIRSFWPGVDPLRLKPGYAGIRPKLGGCDDPSADFRIDGPDRHGLPGLINLFGIESPGLTASLAIAEEVASCLQIDTVRV